MVLLRKNDTPAGLRDYRLISLIHSFSKLVSKGLALRLAPFMDALVRANQMALIKGRRIHDNFRSVQLYCRWLHARQYACILLKVDIAKAFDSVAWPFLLEVLERMVFPQSWRDWIAAMLSCEHKGAGQWSLGPAHLSCKGFATGRPAVPFAVRNCYGSAQCHDSGSRPQGYANAPSW
jgi:hypothetical protein